MTDPRIRLKECRTLVDAGATVRLVARSSPVRVATDDIEVVELGPRRGRPDRVAGGLRELLAHARTHRADVIHFHDPEILAAAPVLRRYCRALIYDVHESLPDLVLDREWIPQRLRHVVGSAAHHVEPRLAAACDGFVFVDGRWASRFPDRPWRAIGNPPMQGEFSDARHDAPPAPPHFVYVGEILRERGPHWAVRAVNALGDDARLTLAGPVSPELAAELQRLDTKGRLTLPGLVDRTQMGELLGSATAGLVLLEPVPAYDDATATKIHEYLDAGLPIVLSDTTAHRRIAETTDAAVVVPYDDVAALEAAFTELMRDATRWRARASAAVDTAAAGPSWTNEAPKLVDLYCELTERDRTSERGAASQRALGLLDDLEPELSSSPAMARLRAVTEQLGRRPRVLHIGNIANNAYNNAKMLNAAGIDSDVIAYDYYHIMGCPEWEDADIVGVIDDDMNPDWDRVELGGFVRPEWFAQGPRDLCTAYLRARWAGDPNELARARRRMDLARLARKQSYAAATGWGRIWHQRRRIPGAVWRRGRAGGVSAARAAASAARRVRVYAAGPPASAVAGLPRWAPARIHNGLAWRVRTVAGFLPIRRQLIARIDNPLLREQRSQFDMRCEALIEEFAQRFPDRPDRLTHDDFIGYRWAIDDWRATFECYDLVEAYSTDPILAMLIGTRPYVAYEHGTIRDIPFEDSAVGRLTALAYAKADAVVITNPDCLAAAEQLGVRHLRFVPHLIDRKYYDRDAAQSRPLPPGVRAPYVFCPARQHWGVKGNDIALRAFAAIADEHPDLQLVISSWGPDVDRSRALLDAAGLSERVALIAPLRIRDLIAVTMRAEVLIDQFRYAVFGGIGPTALACGTPLVTNLDHSLSSWCMQEPPYFQAHDLASCTDALRLALAVDRDQHRREQLEWMRRNYWYGDVATRHIDIQLDLLGA